MKNINYLIVITLFILVSKNKLQSQNIIPRHDSFTIESKQVNETRVIAVWTPDSYNNGSDSFPVLYMPDGGVKEDFPHIANTIAKLIEQKSISPIILVGIENTERGRDLTAASEIEDDAKYCPLSNGAENFRNFITEELFSVIAKKYRVTDKKGIIGESLAGLFVMETFMNKPQSFDFYIAMDPSLWWNNHYLVRNADTLLNNLPNRETKLWFAGSNAEDISPYTKKISKILQKKVTNKLKWKYSNEPNEKHNTIFRATKEKALIWTLNINK